MQVIERFRGTHTVRTATLTIAIVALAALTGCNQLKKRQIHQMGERVQVGPVVYTVIEADWVSELGSGSDARVPQNRFLTVRVSMSNVGNREVTVPLLSIENEAGKSTLELSEGQGIDEWLGVLRTLNPTETHSGKIAFDASPGGYLLRLTDGGEGEAERVAYVTIPVRVQSGGSLSDLPAPAPPPSAPSAK